MSESVKKVAGLVGIVALGFVTFGVGSLVSAGVAGGASFGAALGSAIGGGLAIGGVGVSFAVLSAVGVIGLTVATTPSLEQTGAGSRSTPFADPNAVGYFVFGRTLLPMSVLYEEQHGNAPDRQVTDIFGHCWHEIEGYVSMRLGGDDGIELVSFSGEAATGGFADLLWWIRADGSQTQSLQDTHTVPQMNSNSWPSDAIGTGVAHSAVIWNIDDDGFTAKYSGVPQRIEIEADAAKLYDPREDNAYGSGSQDFDDPSTWTFPTNDGNAVLVALRMLVGERTSGGELIWGRGALETQINLDNWAAMASVCDESLDGAYRFTLAGFWRLTGDWEGFARRWEEETGGKIYKVGGVYHVWVPHDDLTPLTTITEADFLEGPSIEHTVASGIDDLYNTARGRYIEPTEGYNGFPYPEVSEASAVADDGGKRILNQDFSWIQSRTLAERTVRLRIRRSRYQRVWVVPLGWPGQGPNYAPFTVHTLNCRETGNTDQLVRVMYRDMSFDGGTVLVLQEENIEIYDDTVELGSAFNSDAIPARIDRLGTTHPRYIDGTSIDVLRPAEPGADVTAPRLGGNLISNGGFETGTFEGWQIGIGSISTALTRGVGTYSIRQDFDGTSGGSAQARTSPRIPAPAVGSRLLAQGFAARDESDLPNRNAFFSLSYYDSSATFIVQHAVQASSSASGWQSTRLISVVPSNAVTVRVELGCISGAGAAGAWYWDDISLHEIPADVDIDALNTTNAPNEAGADRTGLHPDDVVYRQSSAPSHQEGRVWIDTDTGEIFRSVSGVWVFIGSDDVLLLDNVDDDTFTVTGADPGWFSPGSVTGSCAYALAGQIVTLRFPSAITGSSDGVGMNFTGIPSALRPSVQQSAVVFPLADNNSAAAYYGRMRVNTDGSFSFALMEPSGSYVQEKFFAATNVKGIGAGLQMSYSRA